MAIRKPAQTFSYTSTATTTDSQVFTLPQDTDAITVKVTSATFTGTNPTVDIYVQTTDDGGTTWYDMGNVGQVTAAIVNQNARFASFTTVMGADRGIANFTGSVAASTTAAATTTGLPLMSNVVRIFFKYGGTQLANSGVRVDVITHQQSATAA